jgi:hypothetical protein
MKCMKWLVTIWIVAALMSLALPVWAADEKAPVFQPMPAIVANPQQTLVGQADLASLVEVLGNDQALGQKVLGQAVCDDKGSFFFNVTLQEGINTIYAHIVTAQGFGPLSTPLELVLDTQPPSPPRWDPLGPIVEATQYIYGTAESNSTVQILLDGQFAQQVVTDLSGHFHSLNLHLAADWNELTAVAIDLAGNQSSASDAFSVFVPVMLAEYSQALDKLASLGILRGYADGTYRPYNPVTRAEFAALLDRTLTYASRPLTSPLPEPQFSDITPTHWATAPISHLAANGLLKGFPDGSFHPDDWITGKEVIAAIVRAAGLEREAQAAREMLGDAPWYYGYSIVGAQHGLLYSNFTPDENALRGEVASSLAALVDLFDREGQTP